MRGRTDGYHCRVKPTRSRGSWFDSGLPYWLRGLIALAAAIGGLLFAQPVADDYRATLVFRQAPVCGGEGCVRTATGEVRDRRSGERCTSNGATTTGGGESCTTSYSLRVTWPGRSEWLEVGVEAYTEARTGERAQLRIWQGEVVALDVLGHSRSYPPESQTDLGAPLARTWLALGLAAWALFSGRGITLVPVFFGSLMVGVLILMVGPDVLIWSPPVFWGALAVLAGGITVGTRAACPS